MEEPFTEALNTLHQAHIYLRQEMGGLIRAETIDDQALCRLKEMARSFQEQAHSLLVMMVYQEVPEALRQEAEDLVSYFSGAVTAIEAMRAPDK